MIKKFISLLAATAMMVTAVTGAMSVTAVNSISNELKGEVLKGKCGESAEWLINSDGVLVISGTGEMKKPSGGWSWGEKFKVDKDINELVIENGITSTASDTLICPFGYYYCSNISKIILPPSFVKLYKTFDTVNNFEKLKDFYIYSKNITDTAYQASNYPGGIIWHVYKDSNTEKSLRNDLKLTDEDIEYIPDNEQMPTVSNKTPAELEPITETSGPSGLFSKYEYNESSKTLTFSGKGAISIADYYKNYAKKTEHIIIESGITKIFAYTGVKLQEHVSGAFYGFTALNDVKLPNTLTEIGELSFYETPLANINFPEGLEQIGVLAFYKTNLGDISFPNSLKKIGGSAFNHSKIKSINLHEGMSIGGAAFSYCESLKEITIPKNTTFARTTIGAQGMSRQPSTFAGCTELEKIIIEDGSWLGDSWGHEFTSNGISDSFCAGCTLLKAVIIKGNVDYIAQEAFSRCTSLTDIYLYNTGLKTITAKGTNTAAPNASFTTYTDSFDTTNGPTFHVVKGSITEETMRNAGYLTADNTVYLADTTALETAIADAEAIETDKYTDESVSEFTKAIESAKAVLENLNATQDEVDNAVKAIEDAKNALAEKPDEPSSSDPSDSSDPSNSSGNNNQSQSPNTPATPPTSAPTTATPKPTTPPTITTTAAKPAKVKAVKLKAKKKKLNVSWKKVSGATGYEVLSATNNKFTKGKKTVTVKKNKVTLKKLKPKKKYFIKVRAYKLANGRKYFGKWSKVVKKKVK